MARLAEKLEMKMLLALHNDPNDFYHLELRKVVTVKLFASGHNGKAASLSWS